MIDHFGINCKDYAKAQEFYDRVLPTLGYTRQLDFGDAVGYGPDGQPDFWIAEGATMGPNRETHFAFKAADEDSVRSFYDAAVELGAESLHAPRLWPEYGESYFAAFVRDPDGNNVEAVCHA